MTQQFYRSVQKIIGLLCFVGWIALYHCINVSWAESEPSKIIEDTNTQNSTKQKQNPFDKGTKTVPVKTTVAKPIDPHRLEWGILPALGYDTDTGFGFGIIGTLAKFHPDFNPYRWRLEALVFMTLKVDQQGNVTLPFHDDYLVMDFPGLAKGRVRLTAKAGFARYSNAGYYGLGAASVFDKKKVESNAQYHQYDRIYPNASLNLRLNVYQKGIHKLQFYVGSTFAYNWISVYPGSRLEQDLQRREEKTEQGTFLRSALQGINSHPLWLWEVGFIYDSRNHEYAPSNGMFHEVSFRGSPGVAQQLYFGGVNATTRFYVSLWKEYLVLAARLVGDLLFGNVPLYEQARYGGFFPKDGPGGGYAVRGVPLHRYHGKIKMFGNLELRSKIIEFHIAGERFNIGLVGFFDAGRVWSDAFYSSSILQQQIDGSDIGVKYGVGGGLRIQWGETFVIRADVSYSPSDDNVGVYIDINHIF